MNAVLLSSCDSAGLPHMREALALVLRHCPPPDAAETIPLSAALGRVLAQDVRALVTAPPCDRSAMDGYAFRHGTAAPLHLIGAAPAGQPFAGLVQAGECVAIATGGALPAGCDTVALAEHCAVTAAGILVQAKGAGANVRRQGEDFRAGASLMAAGGRLNARHIALLAAAGVKALTVRPGLRTAILSLGDELLATGPDAIRDANRPMLASLCAGRGHRVSDLGILPDNRALLADMMTRAAHEHDVILLSAGTSASEGDHVRGALLDCGGQLLVSGVAIRPGKPVSFGRIGRTLVIALPGNPAAAHVTFLLMGLPLLRWLEGDSAPATPWQPVQAGFSHRKKPGLREFLRARLVHQPDGTPQVQACRDNGPAMLCSLAQADGLIMLAEDETGFAAGARVLFAGFTALEAP